MGVTVRSAILLAALLGASSAPTIAQDDEAVWKIDAFTCRELLLRGGDERDFVLVFMHGYMSGKLNEMSFDAPALTAATDAVLDSCIGNPDQPLLSAFEAARR